MIYGGFPTQAKTGLPPHPVKAVPSWDAGVECATDPGGADLDTSAFVTLFVHRRTWSVAWRFGAIALSTDRDPGSFLGMSGIRSSAANTANQKA